MKNSKEDSLLEALKWASLPSLPEEDDKENIWIDALALVEKSDGTESYVALTKDDKLENKIIKDFGSVSIVRSIKQIYPYVYLSSAFVPMFKTRKKEERIAFLTQYKKDWDLSEMSLKELDKLVIIGAIKKQKSQIEREKNKDNEYEQ